MGPMPNRAAFVDAFRRNLATCYAWAADADRLARFMAAVEETIGTSRSLWTVDGACAQQAWIDIGGTGKVTLKKLRALPATGDAQAP